MGSNTSKTSNGSFQTKNESEIGGNHNDPRSPTPEIVRTPLNGKQGAKHNITKNADLRKTFENVNGDEKLIQNNPILSAVIKNHLQSYDPRSPTQEFDRTPIIISSKNEEPHEKDNVNFGSPIFEDRNAGATDRIKETKESSPNNMIPKNLCNGFFDLTLDETIQEPLGSSTASNDAIEENINESDNKPKLLETNFDYVGDERDNKKNSDKFSNIPNDKKIGIIPRFKIIENDPRSPSADIDRTPIVVTKVDGTSTDENVEDMSDDSLIKVLQNTNADLRSTATKQKDGSQEALMIYVDETDNIDETPKKSKSTNVSGSRTPLSCMKNKADGAHARSKSANTLYDPKKQKVISSEKSPKKHVSHIPRLKSLTIQPKMVPSSSSISLKSISKSSGVSGDCENTPPNSHRDRWDKDSSVVL